MSDQIVFQEPIEEYPVYVSFQSADTRIGIIKRNNQKKFAYFPEKLVELKESDLEAILSKVRKSGKGEISWNTRPIEDALTARIAELEALVERLIEAGNWLNAMHEDGVFVDELNAARTSWKLAVSDWQSMPSHVTNPLESQGIVTRNGGEG